MNRRSLLNSMMLGAVGGVAAGSGLPRLSVAATPLAGARPGARNLITDVAGLKIGQAQDIRARSGVTVLLPDAPAVAAVDVRGGGPGTRETDALTAENLVQTVDAITLSGGSVYGLSAGDGVTAWLGAQGKGYGMARPGVPLSPIVPGAILYDLANGGNKDWGLEPPYRKLALQAVQSASVDMQLGTVGAGYGAMAGSLKGGIGSASIVTADGMTLGAIVAVNSFGAVTVPGSHKFWAAPFEIDKEFGGLGVETRTVAPEDWGAAKANPAARQNTTIACIATDVALTRPELKRIAMMAQDGLAHAIRPIHAPFDGDVIFALSTGKVQPSEPRTFVVARLGALAADTLARACARATYLATPWPDAPDNSWKALAGK